VPLSLVIATVMVLLNLYLTKGYVGGYYHDQVLIMLIQNDGWTLDADHTLYSLLSGAVTFMGVYSVSLLVFSIVELITTPKQKLQA
jgi:hypothetical protein